MSRSPVFAWAALVGDAVRTRSTTIRPKAPVRLWEAARRGRYRVRDGGSLGQDGLDVPLPGSLLVLLSRLHRSEGGPRAPRDDGADG